MHGTVIAVSRNLGVVVVQTGDGGCAVLEVRGLLTTPLSVGDRIEGERGEYGAITLSLPAQGEVLSARIDDEGLTRSEAVSRVSIL